MALVCLIVTPLPPPVAPYVHVHVQDVLVVTAPSSGAEVIPFLKTYVNLPGAVAFPVLYSKLCNSFEQVNPPPAPTRACNVCLVGENPACPVPTS